jgi:hypothetical protein
MLTTDVAPQEWSWFRGPAGRRYGLQLMLVVIAKLVALTILYFAFIAPQPRTDLSPGAVQQHLLDANPANVSGASP